MKLFFGEDGSEARGPMEALGPSSESPDDSQSSASLSAAEMW
eukprot:CAMPEP_0177570816 /NCGR_PEP_ID=MMETSP0369-20130122/77066_1 /TAXON_ID=447022 ORGANISM="Scrippsiella hangoei-like, Strain SHHI-4" /NCGR_SAMPLE_ID=MMETSP0369 /ASSEMBLY_ACC=CAM_ASM_000364 /LENGTH=41 /DNA_ID= /DNA_START= /DNA_END= /DNA_ORIENTATION=